MRWKKRYCQELEKWKTETPPNWIFLNLWTKENEGTSAGVLFCSGPWAHSPLVSNGPSLTHRGFPRLGTGYGTLILIDMSGRGLNLGPLAWRYHYRPPRKDITGAWWENFLHTIIAPLKPKFASKMALRILGNAVHSESIWHYAGEDKMWFHNG